VPGFHFLAPGGSHVLTELGLIEERVDGAREFSGIEFLYQDSAARIQHFWDGTDVRRYDTPRAR